MKKIIISIAASIVLAGSLSAQLFVGGSLSFGTQSGENSVGTVSTEKASYYNFSLSPTIGFYLSDNFALGTDISFGVNGDKDPDVNGVAGDEQSRTNFSIKPFARIGLFEVSNVNLIAKAGFGLGFGSSSFTSGGVTVDGPSIFELSIGVIPVVSYDFSDNIALEASIGYLGFRNETATTAAVGNNPETKDTDTYIGLDLNTGLSLGFIYKF